MSLAKNIEASISSGDLTAIRADESEEEKEEGLEVQEQARERLEE
jgi:hypothetical protein